MAEKSSTKNIRFEPNSEAFMDYAINNHVFPGVSTYTAIVNYALAELQKTNKIKVEVTH